MISLLPDDDDDDDVDDDDLYWPHGSLRPYKHMTQLFNNTTDLTLFPSAHVFLELSQARDVFLLGF